MTGKDQGKMRKILTRSLAIGAVLGFYCLATASVSGVMMAATDMSVQAKGGGHGGGGHGGGGHGGGGHGGPHFGGGGRGGPHFGGGRVGGGRVVVGGGGRGHFWHGHYYGYGVGPCWQRTPLGWIWICG
jgi:hypothetical protein